MLFDLLASIEPLVAITRYVRFVFSRAGLTHLAIIVGSAVLLFVGMLLIDRIRRQREARSRSPRGLFLELCAAHRLNYSERSSLWSAAETLPARDCCRVFIEPEILGKFANSDPLHAEPCSRLARKLFGDRAA